MRVKHVMQKNVITITPETSYEEAARLMHEHGFSGLPVVVGEKIVGMISEKDLFRALYPGYEDFVRSPEAYLDHEAREEEIARLRKMPVKHLTVKKVITIEPEAPILQAGGIMLARGIHRLPVVEKGRIVGIVTRGQIYSAILKQHLGL